MKSIKLFSVFAAVALVFSSCDTSLLDIPQMGVTGEMTFYQTDDDCEQATAAAYAASRKVLTGKPSIGQYINTFLMKNLLSDDIRTGSSRTDQTDLQQMWELHIVSTNSWITTTYKELYESIYLCNIVLDKFNAEDSRLKARNIDECRGLRALSYYELITLWGRVPLVDHVLVSNEEFQTPNSEISDLWAFVSSELEDIIKRGNLTQRKGKEDRDGSIRFTIDAARTLLGKVYMYMGKNEEAYNVLTDVIKSDNFGLIDDVRQLYHIQANGCEEYVYEHNRHFDLTNAYQQDGWHGILWNWPFSYTFFAGTDCRDFHNFAETGYSQCQVPKDLYDAFVAEEGENGKRVSAWIVPYSKLPEIGIGIPSEKSYYNSEGYLRLKWLVSRDDEYVGQWHANQANTPVFKYDDVLLLAAEAGLQNHMEDAIRYVNIVRKRAGLAPVSSLTLDDIKKERRLELAMDGVRFQDLKRWGDAAKVLANKSAQLPTLTVTPDPSNDPDDATYHSWKYTYKVTYTPNDYPDHSWTVGREDYLPFPQNEIDVNKAIKQNPGF